MQQLPRDSAGERLSAPEPRVVVPRELRHFLATGSDDAFGSTIAASDVAALNRRVRGLYRLNQALLEQRHELLRVALTAERGADLGMSMSGFYRDIGTEKHDSTLAIYEILIERAADDQRNDES